MLYVRESDLPVDQVSAAIESAARAQGFGVLHDYDFHRILAEKGFPIGSQCRVFEICNPQQASEVLAADMALNMALPCRVSVYEQAGRTVVGMIPPTALLRMVSDDPRIAGTAREVEQAMQQLIDDVVQGKGDGGSSKPTTATTGSGRPAGER